MPDAPVTENSRRIVESAMYETQPQATPVQSHLQTDPSMMVPNDYDPSNPYAMSSMNQQAYMMMALASMSEAAGAMSPPPTVTPAQVTLPNPMDQAFNGLAPANAFHQAEEAKSLESFARIEFPDSVFQMTTYAVIIGRDQRAMMQARRDERRLEEHRRRVEENASKGLPPPSPIAHDRGKFSKSYVSEEGGMLGPESDAGDADRPAKRRKLSTQGSSQHDNDEAQLAQENMISNRQYVSHTPGAAAIDLDSLRPDPFHIPHLGIHSPGPNIATKTKAISREHMKIAYNQKEGVFEAIPLHKNGFFCDDVHYSTDKVVLKSGVQLQIKDISFHFVINGVKRGLTGAKGEENPTPASKMRTHGGKEMSFDFESSHANAEVQDTSDELSDVGSQLSDFGEEEEGEDGDDAEDAEDAEEVEEAEDSEIVETVEAEAEAEADQEQPTPEALVQIQQSLAADPLQQQQLLPQMPKKRGPGRPPKNGIMSKREQRLIKKQQQEMAKKTLPQVPPMEPPIKRKVGRPRKHPLPESASERPEKRKYKPRKPKGEDGAEGSDAERRAREKKEKKARPKSPPLELKIEDYTADQLAKPNKNYGMLIDETLTAAGPDGLTLKQIYKRIAQRYPWFYFHTETKGWESSVRHNLIGNGAFTKNETTGVWLRVPGVGLDAGKKRKSSPPKVDHRAAQAYAYNAPGNPPAAPAYHPQGQPPQGYPVQGYTSQQPQQPQQGQPVRPVQPYGASASPPGQPAPAAGPAVISQLPAPAQLPGYGAPPAPARPQLGAPQQGTYSSPYARPPPPANPGVKIEEGQTPAPGVPAHQPPLAAAAAKTVPGPAPVSQQPRPAPTPTATAAAPNRPSTATPTPATPARPAIEPRLLQAVVKLKNGLIHNLNTAHHPQSEAIVMSALNRCIGLKKEATENEKMEKICMKGIGQVIDGFIQKQSPTPGGSPPAPDTPRVLDPKVLSSLNEFKEISVKTLKSRLSDRTAEILTLSAIDRVLGLAEASIVPPPEESTPINNLEGVEQHIMRSIRHLLTGMNQKLPGAEA